MSGGAASKAEKEEKVQKSERGDRKQDRIVITLTKTCFLLSFSSNTQNYLHQTTLSSAVNFRQPQDGNGPGGEGFPRPGPISLLGPR